MTQYYHIKYTNIFQTLWYYKINQHLKYCKHIKYKFNAEIRKIILNETSFIIYLMHNIILTYMYFSLFSLAKFVIKFLRTCTVFKDIRLVTRRALFYVNLNVPNVIKPSNLNIISRYFK